jgi:hypothetical protein
VKLPPTVPLNSVLLTADRAAETVKGHFFFAIYLPEEVQVRGFYYRLVIKTGACIISIAPLQ